MAILKQYRNFAKKLLKPLETVRRLSGLEEINGNQENMLRAAVKEIAVETINKLKKHQRHKKRPRYSDIRTAAGRFEKTFGHPPSNFQEFRRNRLNTEDSCVDRAASIAKVLELAAPGRVGALRIDGPHGEHTAATLQAANGKTFVADNWGTDNRAGVAELEQFRSALISSIGKKRHRLFGLSDALGLHQLKNPQQHFKHPQSFWQGGLNILTASSHENLAAEYLARGEDQEAMKQIELALKVCPESNMAHFMKGEYYSYQEKFAEAIRHYEKALELYPYQFAAMENLAYAHKATGNLEEYQKTQEKLSSFVRFSPIAKEMIIALDRFLDSEGNETELLRKIREFTERNKPSKTKNKKQK